MPRHEIDDAGHVTGTVRVAYRLVRGARPAVPGGGALVQGGHDFRFGAAELTAEHLGEEMVIAEPLPRVVEWDDEEVFPFEDVDNFGRIGRSGHGITQRRAKSAQDRGAEEKLPHFRRLAAEHLLGQKLFDKPAITAELADDVMGRRASVQQKRRQVDPGGPAFGQVHELSQVGWAELEASDRGDELGRMRGREPQLVRPDLGHPAGPHAGQRQRRVGPRNQHQLDRRWQVQQQESELVMAVGSLITW